MKIMHAHGKAHKCLEKYDMELKTSCSALLLHKLIFWFAKSFPQQIALLFWYSDPRSVCVLVSQSCSTLCDLMDYSPPSSSVHGIFQARTLEWVAISFSKGSSQPRNRTQVSCTAGRFFPL